MFKEIEKTFKLTKKDLEIIKNNFVLKSEEEVIDKYFDYPDFRMYLNKTHQIKLRSRNSKLELKVQERGKSYETDEFYWDSIDEKLAEFWYNKKDLQIIYIVKCKRSKYATEFHWNKFVLDLDIHEFWEKYDIEVEAKTEEIWVKLIDEFTKKLWLEAILVENLESKWKLHIKDQNPKLYEIIKNMYWK